jgi:hypothetical protein
MIELDIPDREGYSFRETEEGTGTKAFDKTVSSISVPIETGNRFKRRRQEGHWNQLMEIRANLTTGLLHACRYEKAAPRPVGTAPSIRAEAARNRMGSCERGMTRVGFAKRKELRFSRRRER